MSGQFAATLRVGKTSVVLRVAAEPFTHIKNSEGSSTERLTFDLKIVRRVVPKKLSEELGRNRCTLYSGLVGSILVQLVAVFERGIPRHIKYRMSRHLRAIM